MRARAFLVSCQSPGRRGHWQPSESSLDRGVSTERVCYSSFDTVKTGVGVTRRAIGAGRTMMPKARQLCQSRRQIYRPKLHCELGSLA
eukprot:2081721-Rhodomonas_salina.2